MKDNSKSTFQGMTIPQGTIIFKNAERHGGHWKC
jgi:hypothetical protein